MPGEKSDGEEQKEVEEMIQTAQEPITLNI